MWALCGLRSAIERLTIQREQVIERAARLKDSDFDRFAPLLEDLNLGKRYATLGIGLIFIRRISLLFLAMFALNLRWIQLHSFILLSLVSVVYTVAV